MSWNIAPECTSIVILSIVWLYSLKGSVLPTLRNQAFQACFAVTFFAMLSNVLSSLMIENYRAVPLILNWIVTTTYFIFTPLMGMVYYFYSMVMVCKTSEIFTRLVKLSAIPGIIYMLLILTNPITKNIFDINWTDGYVRGKWVVITYIVFYFYCAISLILVLSMRKKVEKKVYKILVAFPVIAFGVVIVQQLYPNIILSGAAATSALLIIYLYLQNKQISIDYLTNIPNRQELLNMIDYLIKKQGKPSFAITVLSLRDFKQINDTYGQQSGDLFLKAVCSYLLTVAQDHCLYRFSGDEFAILIKDDSQENVEKLIRMLMKRMEEPWKIGDYGSIIEGAIGVAHYPISAKNLEGIINGIECAISKAKAMKESKVCFCDEAMLKETYRKHHIIQILKEKCANNSFELYYQPIIELKSKCFVYAESLMRINDSPLGPIYPSEFIPIAEDTGLIVEITYQILDRVCKFIKELEQQGTGIDRVHINFSGVQFGESNLVDKINSIIAENQVSFSKIKIEFTESAIADNPKLVTDFVKEMSKSGVHIGLDDFGIGYSNIDSVINIPFDTIKLDKSLIWSAVISDKSAIMVRNLSKAFHELGLKVLAEGVETEEQNQFVADCEMDLIQGYLYAKPMSEADTKAFLAQKQSEYIR